MAQSHPYVIVRKMVVALDKLAARGRAVLREDGRGFELAGLRSTVGGSERVEVLVARAGGDVSGPGRYMFNLTRSGFDSFEHDLRSKLDAALRKRRA